MAITKTQDLNFNSKLYRAMMNEQDDLVIDICRQIPKGPLHTVTIHEDTVLHMATYHKRTGLALRLLDMVSSCDYHKLTWQNSGGNTILHETGTNNRTVKVAEEVLRRAPMLLSMTNKEGETALFYAARHGKSKIFKFLHGAVSRTVQGPDIKTFLHRDDKFTILHIAILSRNYWIAHMIATTYPELIREKDADDMTALQLLSTTRPEFHPHGFFNHILFKVLDADIESKETVFFFLKKIWKQKHAHEWAYKIAKLLIEEDNSWEHTESWTDKRVTKLLAQGGTASTIVAPDQKNILANHANFHKPNTPLLLATIHGSTEIVREILIRYPQAVEHVDKDGRNILHLAILHRRHGIIDVVEDMEYPLERLKGKLDKQYNTLLHMVGQKEEELKEDVKHPAEELKIDQRLYTRVEKLSPILDTMTRNSDQKTPFEVFSETNHERRAQAKEWMSENAKNCSIVAVLIATVAFTSVYTIPGGTDDLGVPVLKNEHAFLLFTFADAISLSSALTSLILFLNIVTSEFHFTDFASSIFKKQYTALGLLFISVTMMMVSFAATLIMTITNDTKWTTEMTLYGVTFFPVLVFILSYVPTFQNIIKDCYKLLMKFMEKVVTNFHKFWDYKPQARHPVARSVHLTTRSPV